MDGPDALPGDPTNALSDPGRLAALARTGLPDPAAGPSFDRLARLAARFLGVPVSLVSLIDADRQFFPGCVGLPEPWAARGETPLSHSFCQHVVTAGAPLIIPDARRDDRVKDNRAVDEIGVIAYLGIPLALDGLVIGSFCAIDGTPRDWSADDVAVMTDLAESVVAELRLRAESAESERQRRAAEEARRSLQVTLTSIGDAVVAVDAAGSITFLNPVAEGLTGWAVGQAVGPALGPAFGVLDLRFPGPADVPVPSREALLTRDGVHRQIESVATPVRAADGASLGAVLVFRDITARREAVRSLALNEERLRMALDASRMVAWEWTPADGSLRVSENATAIFGLPEGTDLAQIDQGLGLVHPDDVAHYRRTYERAIAELGSYLVEYRLVRNAPVSTASMSAIISSIRARSWKRSSRLPWSPQLRSACRSAPACCLPDCVRHGGSPSSSGRLRHSRRGGCGSASASAGNTRASSRWRASRSTRAGGGWKRW